MKETTMIMDFLEYKIGNSIYEVKMNNPSTFEEFLEKNLPPNSKLHLVCHRTISLEVANIIRFTYQHNIKLVMYIYNATLYLAPEDFDPLDQDTYINIIDEIIEV